MHVTPPAKSGKTTPARTQAARTPDDGAAPKLLAGIVATKQDR